MHANPLECYLLTSTNPNPAMTQQGLPHHINLVNKYPFTWHLLPKLPSLAGTVYACIEERGQQTDQLSRVKYTNAGGGSGGDLYQLRQ